MHWKIKSDDSWHGQCRVQCSECLLYWNQRIVYCICGHLLKESEGSQHFHQWRLDALLDWKNVGQINTGKRLIAKKFDKYRKILFFTLNKSGKKSPMTLRSDFREDLQRYTVSTVNLEKSDPNEFLLINTKGGIRRLLHPAPHGGSGTNTCGAHDNKHQVKPHLTSCNEQPQRTGRLVWDAQSSRISEWNFWRFFLKCVAVRRFTVDSNLLQPTGGVNRTPSHVTHFKRRTWLWLKVSCVHHVMSSCVWLCVWSDTLRPSTLHSSQSLSSSSSFFFFHVGWFDEKSSFRERGVRHFDPEQSSHKLWANFIATDIFIQESSRDNRPSNLHHLEFGSMTTPSAERSLHHCFRSEKIQRAVDKFVTVLTKACCPVSRRLSVILEQGDLFSMSVDHLIQTSEKNQVATQKMSKLGFCLNDKKKENLEKCPKVSRSSLTVKQRFANTSSRPILTEEVFRNWMELSSLNEEKLIMLLQVMNNFDEINNFFKNNYQNKIGIFMKLMRKVLLRWKNWSDFKNRESMNFREEIEDQDTILEFTGKIQELQKEINCMNDSGWISTRFLVFLTTFGPHHFWPTPLLKPFLPKLVRWKPWPIGLLFGTICCSCRAHDNGVASFRIWSRRSLHRFYGRARTYGNRSDKV